MRKGDKLKCLNDISNLLGQPLFVKGEIYEVLYVNNEGVSILVCLNHILYANEYNSFPIEWVKKNFKKQ
jgi:hypothetical protein